MYSANLCLVNINVEIRILMTKLCYSCCGQKYNFIIFIKLLYTFQLMFAGFLFGSVCFLL